MNKAKVSVFIVTYNHEHYIGQTIESVLLQKTDFDFDIVIGEDCSKDRTREIVLDYQEKYPGRIKLLLNEQNLGLTKNWIQTLNACQGKYVALLEGDDYWTDPEKLQGQADFLDAHPEFSMCFHNAKVVYEGLGDRESHLMTTSSKEEFTLNDITQGWSVHTATVMYRKAALPELPAWFEECVFLDLPLFAVLAQKGRVKYLNRVMSVYRKNAGSLVFGRDYERVNLGLVKMHKLIDQHLGYAYHKNLSVKMAEELYSIAINMYQDGKRQQAAHYLRKSVQKQLSVFQVPEKYKVLLFFNIYMPFLYKFYKKAVKRTATN